MDDGTDDATLALLALYDIRRDVARIAEALIDGEEEEEMDDGDGCEARRRERERYDERTRLLEERITRGIERLQRRRDAS